MTDHPIIESAKKNTFSEGLGPDEFADQSILKFMCEHPSTRKHLLDQLDTAITADDGVDLRKKASLLTLGRKLSRAHRVLLKANR